MLSGHNAVADHNVLIATELAEAVRCESADDRSAGDALDLIRVQYVLIRCFSTEYVRARYNAKLRIRLDARAAKGEKKSV